MQDKMLCYDTLSGQYFMSSLDDILRAKNEINRMALDSPVKERYIDLINKLRVKLGLPELPDMFVYFVNRPDGVPLVITFVATMTNDNKPCVCIDFNIHKTKHKVKVRKKKDLA